MASGSLNFYILEWFIHLHLAIYVCVDVDGISGRGIANKGASGA